MERFGVRAVAAEPDGTAVAPAPATTPGAALLAPPYRPQSLGIIVYGLSWGVVNWGFITFLPVFLVMAGAGTQASRLLFLSSLLALPTTAFAAVLYARWSTRRAMLVYPACTVAVLFLFAVLSPQRPGRAGLLVVLVSVLLSGIAGMIAMLSPYAAEVYPTTLRATGGGMAAASSKVGGMFGPLLLTSAPRLETLAVISALPVAAAAAVFWRIGQETSGRPLVEFVARPEPVTTAEQEG
jgi:putative MFS transporter